MYLDCLVRALTVLYLTEEEVVERITEARAVIDQVPSKLILHNVFIN